MVLTITKFNDISGFLRQSGFHVKNVNFVWNKPN